MDAEDLHVLAHVGAARPALVAGPIDDVRLSGDVFPKRDPGRARAARHDDAGHLVAERHRRWTEVLLRPRVPALDVHVRAAHARGLHADRAARPGPAWNGYFADSGARCGDLLDQGAHRRSHRRGVEHGRRLGGHGQWQSVVVRMSDCS